MISAVTDDVGQVRHEVAERRKRSSTHTSSTPKQRAGATVG
jgi:hypothetical protein